MDFPTPAPFLFSPPPGTFLGRSLHPQLPPVGGYSREDLERMRFMLSQSGADPQMLGRVNEVIARHSSSELQSQMLSAPTTAQKAKALPAGAMQARQNLLNALSPKR